MPAKGKMQMLGKKDGNISKETCRCLEGNFQMLGRETF
jgi:hypothetical protein